MTASCTDTTGKRVGAVTTAEDGRAGCCPYNSFLFCLACKLMRAGHLIPRTEVTAGSELCSECWESNPGPQQSNTFA